MVGKQTNKPYNLFCSPQNTARSSTAWGRLLSISISIFKTKTFQRWKVSPARINHQSGTKRFKRHLEQRSPDSHIWFRIQLQIRCLLYSTRSLWFKSQKRTYTHTRFAFHRTIASMLPRENIQHTKISNFVLAVKFEKAPQSRTVCGSRTHGHSGRFGFSQTSELTQVAD